MTSKHYQEQKMLIENFRKWEKQEQEDKELIQESLIDALQIMSMITGTLYMMGPYLKIAVHHPKVKEKLEGPDSNEALRALSLGLQGADNAGQWLEDFGDKIFDENVGTIQKLKNSVYMFAFLAILFSSGFPVGASIAVRGLPRLTMFLKKKFASAKRKIKRVPEKTPEEQQLEDELEELKQLEEEKAKAQQLALSLSDVMDMVKDDPEQAAEQLGVELSDEDRKNLKIDEPSKQEPIKKSKATKVVIPPRNNKDSAENPREVPKNLPAVGTAFMKKKK
tara:strand:- start:1005 stop:1841 length:837 start_codon:yes stop_codon:yes gene_type:complete